MHYDTLGGWIKVARISDKITLTSHFACGDLTPPATKGVARPLWKPHLVVPASRGEIYME